MNDVVHRLSKPMPSERERRDQFRKQNSLTFSMRLSDKIDSLIEGHLQRNQPRELFIPGLDEITEGKHSKDGGGIFDSYDPDYLSPTRVKSFQAPHEKGEGTITGNVGTS